MSDRRAALQVIVASLFGGVQAAACAADRGARHLVGLLDTGERLEWWKAFRDRLGELGYVDGRNVSFESRYAKGDIESLPALARDLVRLDVNVIVTSGTAAAVAAKHATSTIPIVMATGTDQVSLGLIASLAHPGGNVTGLATLASELTAKRFELARELVPQLSRLAVLWHTDNYPSMASIRDLEGAAEREKVALQTVGISGPGELPAAFAAMAQGRAQALIVVQTGMTFAQREQIAALALKQRLPSIYGTSEFVMAGGLASYGPSYADLFRRAATYVQKILEGAKPGDLPVEQPATFELVVNASTARALGITLPSTVLVRASRVLQ
jgi:putative ABC transport system substrate-binding protein